MHTPKKPKEIKLRIFKIENNDITKKDSGLLSMLSNKLDNSKAQDRRMILNQDDPKKEEDLISDYQIRSNILISGAMLRIMLSSEAPSIPDNLFDEKRIVISELDQLEIENSSIYKDHYYFLLNNNYVVTNLPGNYTITRFQTYINWLLEIDRESFFFEFTPMTVLHDDIKLSDLRNIRIQDPSSNNFPADREVSTKKILDLSKTFIFNFLKDVKSFPDIEIDKIISAELLIKFKKSKDLSNEEYQKILGAYLKPICDTENVIFVPKKGSPIKGSEILKIKTVMIEFTESNKVSEPQLLQEMEKFLKEVQNEQKI